VDELAPAAVARLPDAFAGLRVVVVGDVILDAYLDGAASGLSREAPVPVVTVERRREAPGGAGNVAVNLASLGADVRLVSVVGRDSGGERVLALARDLGVDVSGVASRARRATVVKRRLLADGQMLVRFDEGTVTPLATGLESAVASALRERIGDADAVVVADYRAGVMTDAVIEALASAPRAAPVVVDGKDPRRLRRVRPLACTPSFEEAEAALGGLGLALGADRAAALATNAERLLAVTGTELAAVTLDRDGALLLGRDRAPHRVHARPVAERCSAGAGDTFTAALTLGLLSTGDAAVAAEVAAAAAAVVVAKPGTATCSPAELRLRLVPVDAPWVLPAVVEERRARA
jgi:D-beta-D-heptose 7-phosphate kinase / D-beta-D-heptose 1-phosphate adenosyltransferase